MKKECPYSKKCGGCRYQGFSYAKQLDIKQKETEKHLSKFGVVKSIIKSKNIYHYRNKNKISFSYDKKGHLHMGNYIESTHKIVDVDECQIHSELASRIFNTIKDLAIKQKINIFNEDKLKGFLRHVLIRTSNDNKHALVVLVTGVIDYKKKDKFVYDLIKAIPEIDTVVQNINNKYTSMVLGKKSIVLYGDGYIKDELLGNTFCISSSSFYQINHDQTENIYKKAIELASFKGDEIVLDAYCGIGTIGISLAKYVKHVDAVEINKEAIKDAKVNAKINNIKNIKFYAKDAKDFMKDRALAKSKYDVVIVDPPRTGLDSAFIYHLQKLSPNKIVYISCNPETQARDLKLLKRNYKVKEIQPFDMMPFTEHIETVVLLTKNRKK